MPESPKNHHVYCDESCTSARYMVFGGVIVPLVNVDGFERKLKEWRVTANMKAELKWTKVSKGKLAEYKSFVDWAFERIKKGSLHFKSVVFDTTQIDYNAYHKGDTDLGFYKFMYTFLLHKFGCYAEADDHLMYVFLDQRPSKYALSTLCNILNSGIKKKYKLSASVVKQVEARDSKTVDLMQIADVLMGGIGYHCNGHDKKAGAGAAKAELAAYIATKAGLQTLDCQTNWGARSFEIWKFKFPQKKKTRPGA